jgi:nucleoid-associated protein YgaU
MSSRHQRQTRLAGRPTVLALLIGGLVLAGGIALIVVTTGNGSGGGAGRSTHAAALVTSPATTRSAPPAAASSTPASRTRTSSTATPKTSAADSARSPADKPKPVIYTVKRGDNLTVIANWFHVHGGAVPLYEWNKSVVGRNPNLIFAGQKIIVAPNGKISVGH